MSKKAKKKTAGAFNFSNVAAREIEAETTSEYAVSQLADPVTGKCPVIIGVFAGDKNKPMRAEVNKRNARFRNVELPEEAIIKRGLTNTRELFPEHVFRDWYDVVDGDGDAVEYSTEAGLALLKEMPDWILKPLIAHFATPGNFAGGGDLSKAEVKETAGN